MRMQVKSGERGLVRLFAVDLPSEEIPSFSSRSKPGNWPLRDALGAMHLDEAFVECFDVADLEELGLVGYMSEGLGLPEAELQQDAARLSGLKGYVLIVLSAAFDSTAQTLTPRAPLRWIGTYAEETAPVSFDPLPSDAAKGIITPETPKHANPHLTVLWAVLALPVLALVIGAVIYGVTR